METTIPITDSTLESQFEDLMQKCKTFIQDEVSELKFEGTPSFSISSTHLSVTDDTRYFDASHRLSFMNRTQKVVKSWPLNELFSKMREAGLLPPIQNPQ
jgi:hypothetical protein